MRFALLLAPFVLLAAAALAQRPQYEINAQTPEGQMLQQAAQTDGAAKKIEIYEAYLAKYPSHDGAWWAHSQLAPLYLKAASYDKAMQSAEAVLAKDPLNSPIAYNALEAAEKKNDIAAIKAWSARTVEAAQKMLASPKPSDEEDAAAWAREVDFAKQVITRCEYSLYATALASTDPKSVVDLASTLEQRHPQSQYIPQVAAKYVWALQQTGDKAGAARVAEGVLAKDKSNEDLMVIAADHYLQSGKHADKVLEYSTMLVATMEAKAAPQGVDPAAWDKKKRTLLGLGHWMSGMAFNQMSRWPETDKTFRAALPYIGDNSELLAPAYFFLGIANYNMAKSNPKLRAEARRFNELCSKIRGPYQQRAIQNLNAINAGK